MRQNLSRRRGLTFLDLLVALALCVGLTTILLCVAAESDEVATRVHCEANLAQIGQAMMAYSNNERNGGFPRGNWKREDATKPKAFTAAGAKDPFGADGPTTDVTAAIYILLRATNIKPAVFVCPSTDQQPLTFAAGTSARDFSNFPNKKCLSYSMGNPYPSDDAILMGWKWNNTMDKTFAIFGDKNPGTAALLQLKSTSPADDLRKGNSPNHNQAGQNVLYGDGHVDFRTTPFAGTDDDNIYTYGESGKTSGGKGIEGPPMSNSDNILLPTADDDAAPSK